MAGTDELTRGFTYDALYRLLAASGRENQPTAARPWQQSTRAEGVASTSAYTQRYRYDQLGNLQQLTHLGNNPFTRRFDYGSGATNHLQSVRLGPDQVAYQYDEAGNVTQENGSRHSQWDAADQLRQFATWTGTGSAPTLLAYYLYAGGQRVKKLTQTGETTWQVTVYAEGGFEHRYEVSNGTRTGEQTQVAVLDGQHRLFQRRSGDALGDQRPDRLYALDDHLGSTAAQTDTSGQLVGREEYYPFGETSFGSSTKQRYRFCGKELDEENGFYYYGARYYAAWLCRFVSVDPLAAKYAYYTPYQYAGNRPVGELDIDGLEATNSQPSPPAQNSETPSPASTSALPTVYEVNAKGQFIKIDLTDKKNKSYLDKFNNMKFSEGNAGLSTYIFRRGTFVPLRNEAIADAANPAGQHPMTKFAIAKLAKDNAHYKGIFPADYYEGFVRSLVGEATRLNGGDRAAALHEVSEMTNQDNHWKYGGAFYHVFMGVVTNRDYDKVMHFTESADFTQRYGTTIGHTMGYIKESKDVYKKVFGSSQQGWDDTDIQANDRGIKFGSEIRDERLGGYKKSLRNSVRDVQKSFKQGVRAIF